MANDTSRTARRDVLKATAGAATALGVTGLASAEPDDRVEVNVGLGGGRARQAAIDQADAVVREFDSLDLVTLQLPKRAAEALSRRSDVRYVEANGTVRALAQTLPWGVDRVDADVVHDSDTGTGADVAIVDTGIDSDHPDLQANLGSGEAFTSCSGSDCNYDWDDDAGHGTHCAGIAGAVDDTEGVVGVATEATLHAVKVLDGSGSGTFSDVAAGIEHVADQGWDVASLSLGAASGSSALQDAVQYADDNGVLVVAAAGNDGPCSDCVGYPAAYPEVVAVSSTNDSDDLSSFSSTGPEVELAAPGSSVYSTYAGGGYDTLSGTSMACPHVSGAAGVLMANGASASQARQTLKDNAENVGLGDNESGAGLLDVEAAVGGGGGGGDPALAVSTDGASNVGDSSATLNGTLSDLGGASSADVYFEYRQTGADSWTATPAQTLSATGGFSDDVSGLSSDTEYEFRAVADASDGDSDAGAAVTFTTGGGGGGGSAPTIDTFSIENRSNGGWARFEVDWGVSDADGDLDSVELTLSQGGSVVDSAGHSVGGSSASGGDRLQDKKGSGDYDVTLTVTDAAGNETSESETVTA